MLPRMQFRRSRLGQRPCEKRCLLGLLDERMQYHDPPSARRYINGSGNSVAAAQTHLPQLAPQVFDMRRTDAFQSDDLDALGKAQERRLKVLWQGCKLSVHHRAEGLDFPAQATRRQQLAATTKIVIGTI